MNVRHAMTLIEVLLAIVLVGMIALGLYAFLARVGSAREQVALAAQRDHAVSVFLGLVEEDILGAVVELPGAGAGIKGSSRDLSLAGFGVLVDPESTQPARSDVVRARYGFSGGRLTVTRGGLSGETILENIGRVRFRYHNGSEWLSSFDSAAANRLPVAIEIAVWLTAPEGAVEPSPTVAETLSGDGFDAESADQEGGMQASEGESEPWPPPDRLRVIVVPDAPDAGWPAPDESSEEAPA